MELSTPNAGLDQTDLILLLLAAPTDDPRQQFRVEGITRLEKLLFLLTHEPEFALSQSEVGQPFSFEPYHFGPYSKEVYDAVEFLQALQLIVESRFRATSNADLAEEIDALNDEAGQTTNEPEVRCFALTPDGRAIANVLSTRISAEAKNKISALKNRFGRMPLSQLLHYVYSKYPVYTERSKIVGNVLG